MHDDWGTSFKVRTSVNLTPDQWRSAKDAGVHNFLIHFIDGKDDDGGYLFDEHAIHFLCDCPGSETVASCMNFESVVEYIVKTAKYDVKAIIRWTDGTSKQYKNVGNVGWEKYLAIKFNIHILHSFFITYWGKGKIDLLGGIVHRLYSLLVAILKERANDLRLVSREMNSRYGTPGSVRAESSLSIRLFRYVSAKANVLAKSQRTTWKTLDFPSGVPINIFQRQFFVFDYRFLVSIVRYVFFEFVSGLNSRSF